MRKSSCPRATWYAVSRHSVSINAQQQIIFHEERCCLQKLAWVCFQILEISAVLLGGAKLLHIVFPLTRRTSGIAECVGTLGIAGSLGTSGIAGCVGPSAWSVGTSGIAGSVDPLCRHFSYCWVCRYLRYWWVVFRYFQYCWVCHLSYHFCCKDYCSLADLAAHIHFKPFLALISTQNWQPFMCLWEETAHKILYKLLLLSRMSANHYSWCSW